MKLAFMSSVFPKLTLKELVAKAKEHGYEGIEFRPEWKHGHGIELDSSAEARAEAAKIMGDAGLEPCCVSPGCKFCGEDEAERDAQYEKLIQYIKLAAEVGIPRIRVFGDPIPNAGRGKRSASYHTQAEYLSRAAEKAKDAGVILCIETHSNFRAFDAGEVLYRAAYPPALRVNWHLGHCLRHGEDVDEAYRHVKGLVEHAHFSVGGEQVGPEHIERQAELLLAEGFEGFFAVEVINPPEGDEVLKQHAEAWKGLREKLGF